MMMQMVFSLRGIVSSQRMPICYDFLRDQASSSITVVETECYNCYNFFFLSIRGPTVINFSFLSSYNLFHYSSISV